MDGNCKTDGMFSIYTLMVKVFNSFIDRDRFWRCALFASFFLLFTLSGAAADVEYEIYELGPDEKETLIGSGEKIYELSEVKHMERGPEQRIFYVELEQGYSVGAVLSSEKEITGFGLQAIHASGGFSWEWFDLEKDNIFNKLQGCGKLKIQTTGLPGAYLIKDIHFLSDIRLRLNQSEDPDVKTQYIKIKAGGQLSLLP